MNIHSMKYDMKNFWERYKTSLILIFLSFLLVLTILIGSGCAGDIGAKWTLFDATHDQTGQTILKSGRPARD